MLGAQERPSPGLRLGLCWFPATRLDEQLTRRPFCSIMVMHLEVAAVLRASSQGGIRNRMFSSLVFSRRGAVPLTSLQAQRPARLPTCCTFEVTWEHRTHAWRFERATADRREPWGCGATPSFKVGTNLRGSLTKGSPCFAIDGNASRDTGPPGKGQEQHGLSGYATTVT